MEQQSFLTGDIAVTPDGSVLVISEISQDQISGNCFSPQVEPSLAFTQGTSASFSLQSLKPVNDFEVSWISPARLAFAPLTLEEQIVREAAYRAARRVGQEPKAVVISSPKSISIVAFGSNGGCISLSLSKKQPPFVLIKDAITSTRTKTGPKDKVAAPFEVMERWIADGSLGEDGIKRTHSGMIAQLVGDFHSSLNRRNDQKRWFTGYPLESDQTRVHKWLAFGWPVSARVSDLTSAHRANTSTRGTSFRIGKLEDVSFLFQSEPAVEQGQRIISSYEEFLFDHGVEIENEIERPEIRTNKRGTEPLEYASFTLPAAQVGGKDALKLFLNSSAAHGFLLVEDPISLACDVPSLETLIAERAGRKLVAIDGPGGTGKTTTLMRIAAADAAAGRRVAFLVCSVSLKNRLRRLQRRIPGFGSYRKDFSIFSADAITAGDENDLYRTEASRSAVQGMNKPGGGLGLSAENTLEPAIKSNKLGEKLPFLIAAHQLRELTRTSNAEFDTLIIDEAQDLHPQHWLLAFALIARRRAATDASKEMEISGDATVYIAFDERQNLKHRPSILDPLIVQFLQNGVIKVATSREKLQKFALSFIEALSLAKAIDLRFNGSAVQWVRNRDVVRQTSALAENAASIIAGYEMNHPDLYGTLWGGIDPPSLQDRTAEPVSVVHPTDVEDLVEEIKKHEQISRREQLLQLAVALPEAWNMRKPSSWMAGELALRLIASGIPQTRTPGLAIGFGSSLMRVAMKYGAASGMEQDDFGFWSSQCQRLQGVFALDNRRGKASNRYKMVLMRVLLDAVLLRQAGESYLTVADAFSLKGSEVGTLLDLTGDVTTADVQTTYSMATRPRWKLVQGDLGSVSFPKNSGYSRLCREIMRLLSLDILPVLTPSGVRDLQRGESAADELAIVLSGVDRSTRLNQSQDH